METIKPQRTHSATNRIHARGDGETEMIMSAMTVRSSQWESPMLVVPTPAGFAVIPPLWCDEEIWRRQEIDWERRWQAEWDWSNVED
jgi:hypothetical protein